MRAASPEPSHRTRWMTTGRHMHRYTHIQSTVTTKHHQYNRRSRTRWTQTYHERVHRVTAWFTTEHTRRTRKWKGTHHQAWWQQHCAGYHDRNMVTGCTNTVTNEYCAVGIQPHVATTVPTHAANAPPPKSPAHPSTHPSTNPRTHTPTPTYRDRKASQGATTSRCAALASRPCCPRRSTKTGKCRTGRRATPARPRDTPCWGSAAPATASTQK